MTFEEKGKGISFLSVGILGDEKINGKILHRTFPVPPGTLLHYKAFIRTLRSPASARYLCREMGRVLAEVGYVSPSFHCPHNNPLSGPYGDRVFANYKCPDCAFSSLRFQEKSGE